MTAICSKCGRDCRTALALSKHEGKCQEEGLNLEPVWEFVPHKFYDRHENKGAKCPVCKEIWADFLVKSEDAYVCLKCGCHFTPMEKLKEINEWRAKHPVKWRVQAQDRVCGQAEAPDEVKGVSEDSASKEAA